MESDRSDLRTLGTFIDEFFAPWALQHSSNAISTLRLKANFADWLPQPLRTLNAWRIEAWRRERLEESTDLVTVNEQLEELASCLDKALEWRMIERNPMDDIDLSDETDFLVELFGGGIGHSCLREGWARVGVHWTWTLGQQAMIDLPRVHGDFDYLVKLHISGIFRPESGYQRLIVMVNETDIGKVVCRGPASYEFFVPSGLLNSSPRFQVVIKVPDAGRPSDAMRSNDNRFLALRVAKIEVRPAANNRPKAKNKMVDSNAKQSVLEQRALLQDMASLGFNCEFGYVQREAGAEPMNLFRWSFAPIDKLTLALDEQLAGLKPHDALDIQVSDDGAFVAENKIYGFRHHTFVYEAEGGTVERVRRNEYIRLGLLTRSLLDELRDHNKLFVFHDIGQSDLAAVRQLVRALNAYGPNTLLWIVSAPNDALVGSAEQLEPGLIAGYVDDFQRAAVMPVSPYLNTWLKVASNAHKIWAEMREAEAKKAAG